MDIPEILEAMREAARTISAFNYHLNDEVAEQSLINLRAAIAALEGMQKDWQLVPKEPTAAMVYAFRDAVTLLQIKNAYKAMLAAAPNETGEE